VDGVDEPAIGAPVERAQPKAEARNARFAGVGAPVERVQPKAEPSTGASALNGA